MQIRTTQNKGVHIHVGKYVISAQWGYGNYCNNQDNVMLLGRPAFGEAPTDESTPPASTCEVAVWRETANGNEWICTDGSNSQVWGWVDIGTVFELAVKLGQQGWPPCGVDDKFVRQTIRRFIESRGQAGPR